MPVAELDDHVAGADHDVAVLQHQMAFALETDGIIDGRCAVHG